MKTLKPIAGALIVVAAADSAVGQTLDQSAEEQAPGWIAGLAYAVAPDPFVGDADTLSTPFPIIGYLGERFTWLGPSISYDFVADDNWTIAAAGELNFLGFEEDSAEPLLAGLTDRENAFEVGLDVAYEGIGLQVRQDISSTHDGMSANLGYATGWPVSERLALEVSLSVDYLSRDVADYYFGVSALEANTTRPQYSVGDAVNFNAGAQLIYRINRRTLFVGSIGITRLDDAITDSPIVADSTQYDAFIGVVYDLFTKP